MKFYSFYKIAIKGTKHCYIGSTIQFTKRIINHKNSCLDPNSPSHHLKLYVIIREHGGWDNLIITVIETKELETKEEVLIQEQKYIVQHKATLNTIPASTSSLNALIERKNLTPTDTVENRLKRCRLTTAIWKRSHGKEKYNANQREVMRKRSQYKKEVKKLFNCLLPLPEVSL